MSICQNMAYWDFKYVPACLSAICNTTFTENAVKSCAATAIADFQAAVSCLEANGA
jgi:hypothetical protein